MRLVSKLLAALRSAVERFDRIGECCPVCGARITRDQLTDILSVSLLGESVRIHRFCAPAARRARLGQVVRT